MNMSGDIRVKTDRRYKELYNDLRNFAVGDMHELFFLCVCLGYRAKKQTSLAQNGEERFWSQTITPQEYSSFYAIILEQREMDLNSIKDDSAVISEMEKYANAGMEIFLNEFLVDYLAKDRNTLRLDSTYSKELPKALLYFIYEQLQ